MKKQETKSRCFRWMLILLVALVAPSISCQDHGKDEARSSNTPANSKAEGSPATSPSLQPDRKVTGDSAMKSSIEITLVPHKGLGGEDKSERIGGKVSGVNMKECKVVIFTRTDKWYVQPFIDSSDTLIDQKGKWENDTHLGFRYAALLVRSSYKPPSTTGTLPSVGDLVLAVTEVPGKE